jgi:hypothetical protein
MSAHLFRRNEQEANAFQDRRNADSHDAFRYQPGCDEDLVALQVNPAARIPIYDQHMAGLPQSMAPPTMQPPYAQTPDALSGAPIANPLFPPVAQNSTLPSNAPLMQRAFPSGGPLHMNLPTAQAAHQPSQGASALPPLGANPRDYLALHHQGRPSQGLIWPANVDIGIVEICAFCPNWFMIPELVARAIRNNWTREALGKAQLHALDALTWEEWLRASARIQKQISSGCKLIDSQFSDNKVRHNSQSFKERYGPQNDLTATAWHFNVEYEPGTPVQTGHMPLSSLYAGIVNWPVGNDRLLMTQCLEFARNNEHLNLDTSHWDWIIRSQGLTVPPAPVGRNRDAEAYQNLNARVADPQDPRL